MDEAKARAVAGWLIDGARSALDSSAVLGQLCDRLVEGGLPLARVGVFVRTLHPQLMGRSFVWQPGAEVQTNLAPAAFVLSAEYLESPIARVYDTRQPIRRRLADPGLPHRFRCPRGVPRRGNDRLLRGSAHLLEWRGARGNVFPNPHRPGGFSPEELAAIEAVIAPLSASRGGQGAAPRGGQPSRRLCGA